MFFSKKICPVAKIIMDEFEIDQISIIFESEYINSNENEYINSESEKKKSFYITKKHVIDYLKKIEKNQKK